MAQRLWVATKKGLFEMTRSGRGWRIERTHFLADNVSMMLPDPRNKIWLAALDLGHFGVKMHRSRDGGAVWEEQPSPQYPQQPEGRDDKDSWGKPWPWKLMRVWALEAGATPDEVWCGTIPGGLFRSRDAGASWQLVESLWLHPKRTEWFGGGADYPGIHSVALDARNLKRVTVGVSCGGVWVTEDDGATWNCRADGMIAEYMPPERQRDPNIQDPHRVVQCPAQPEFVWAQHHNGIFRSADNSASWQPITGVQPAVFGFAVAVHPRDGNTAWVVPAQKDERRIPVDGKVVVNRTRDGGKTFTTLRTGLPQEHAYDLVYRHALDIDETGDSLAFGSTTGSLWTTDDQGDSWQTVSTHLPPIFCVRFEK